MPEPLYWILLIALTLLAGRTALSLLPPGDPGAQRNSPFPVTWAIAFGLGVGLSEFTARILSSVTSLTYDQLTHDGGAWLLVPLAPWVVIAFLRWRSLPGAMVPRHEVEESRTPTWARGLFAAAWAIVVVDGFRLGLGNRAGDAALMLLWFGPSLHALRVLRVQVEARALLALGIALALAIYGQPSWMMDKTVILAIGPPIVLGGVLWTRRADRRGRALTLLFTTLALGSGALPMTGAFAITLALTLASWKGSAGSTAKLSLVALGIGFGILQLTGRPESTVSSIEGPVRNRIAILLVVVALVATVRAWRKRRPPLRELTWLMGVPVLAFGLGALADAGVPIGGSAADWAALSLPFLFVLGESALLPQDPLARDPRPE